MSNIVVAFNRSLEPANQNEAFELSIKLAKVGLCGVRTPEEALVRIMAGVELGLSTMQAMRGVYVVDGRPALDASLMHSLCLQSPDCEKFECVEQTDVAVTYVAKRRGQSEQRITWTLEDAKRAGLAGKQNWAKYPRQMLHARCKAEAARLVFPERLFGLYTPEEMREGGIRQASANDDWTAVVVEAKTVPAMPSATEQLLTRIQSAQPSEKEAVTAEIQKAISSGDVPQGDAETLRRAYGAKFHIKKTKPKEETIVYDAEVGEVGLASPVPMAMAAGQDFDRGDEPDAY